MKIYLAAPYAARDMVSEYADELTRIGFTVTSSWLDEKHDINDGTIGAATALPDAQVAVHAATDLRDINGSDMLAVFTAESLAVEGGSGGRHVETGYAIAKGLPVLVIGQPENVFHRYPRACSVVPTWHEALIELSARLVGRERRMPRAGQVVTCDPIGGQS